MSFPPASRIEYPETDKSQKYNPIEPVVSTIVIEKEPWLCSSLVYQSTSSIQIVRPVTVSLAEITVASANASLGSNTSSSQSSTTVGTGAVAVPSRSPQTP